MILYETHVGETFEQLSLEQLENDIYVESEESGDFYRVQVSEMWNYRVKRLVEIKGGASELRRSTGGISTTV